MSPLMTGCLLLSGFRSTVNGHRDMSELLSPLRMELRSSYVRPSMRFESLISSLSVRETCAAREHPYLSRHH